MIRGRLRRHGQHKDHSGSESDDYIEIDPSELSGIFKVPSWLRDVGLMSWLLVGFGVLIAGLIWILGLTQVIVAPLIAAGVVATVASPLVRWLHAHRIPRTLGAVLVVLAIVALAVGVTVVVITGITGQSATISGHLDSAKDTISGWLKNLGLDPSKADSAKSDASKSVSALLNGLTTSIEALSGLVFFLALTVLSLFFLLKDGPTIRAWAERHMGVPTPVGQMISGRVLQSLRGYFLGVTIIAAFNAAVVTLGAVLLGVPLAGTIAAVTFIGAYVPYFGAYGAGAFAVMLALGEGGTDAAAGMIVVELLANGGSSTAGAAVRDGCCARHPPARRPDRDDRRRRAVRDGRPGAGGAADSAALRISADIARAEAEATAGQAPGVEAAPA